LDMSTNPILGVVIGTVLTLVVQSSSATIGILQGLYGEGAMSLHAAIPVLFGDNIGTTITAVLAALGASVAAKRADRKSTRLNSSHVSISYAVFCLKKKRKE